MLGPGSCSSSLSRSQSRSRPPEQCRTSPTSGPPWASHTFLYAMTSPVFQMHQIHADSTFLFLYLKLTSFQLHTVLPSWGHEIVSKVRAIGNVDPTHIESKAKTSNIVSYPLYSYLELYRYYIEIKLHLQVKLNNSIH